MASSELDQSHGESTSVGALNAGTASGGGALPRGVHTQMSIGQASGSAGGQPKHSDGVSVVDVDPTETQEWLDSIRYVLESKGVDRAVIYYTPLSKRRIVSAYKFRLW